MSKYKVTANELRLRSTPNSQTNRNIVAVLSNGQLVEKIANAGTDWWEVRVQLSGGPAATGYVANRYLEAIPSQSPPTSTPAPILANYVTPVHLQENRGNVTRKVTTGRAYPLGEPNRPSRDRSSVAAACSSIHNIINWLNVEQSARYAPTSSSTYCNIYAHDYCYLNGVFLPRVWWTSRALIELNHMHQVPVQYGQTVNEMNANSLLRWFLEWGDDFGWRRVFDLNELQAEANRGKVCIISGRNANENSSGHICAVVPENNLQKTTRHADGSVRIPLQSQAGRVNKKYFNNSLWWLTRTFADFGYFVHD
ncbi:MAG: SH3 domain-containing protein [Algoriphagus sp.]|nr:SH3 domain-containing protein [Algoriphagus sp.]